MRVLVDTNIFLDILIQRDPFYKDSQRIFKLVEYGHIEGYIAPITINNIVYIARKFQQPDQIRNFISVLADVFTICHMDSVDVRNAVRLDFKDIEDALQASMAASHQCDTIITSNLSDYKYSPIPAMSAANFLQNYLISVDSKVRK